MWSMYFNATNNWNVNFTSLILLKATRCKIKLPRIINTSSKSKWLNLFAAVCLMKKNFPWEKEENKSRSNIYEAKKKKKKVVPFYPNTLKETAKFPDV